MIRLFLTRATRAANSPVAWAAPRARLLAALGLPLFAIPFLSCSGQETKRPPDLGGCLPADDASCSDPMIGFGATTPDAQVSSSSSSSSSSSGGGALGCGTADGFIPIANVVYCDQCIQGTCCMSDEFCVGDCEAILRCILTCAVGDTTCIGNCENATPNGLAAYQDFAQCIDAMCNPQCPTLQM